MTDLNPGCTRYYTRVGAENAMRFINGTRLDDRIIRTDWDAGFKEGRQYGRGKSGGQVRILNFFFSSCLDVLLSCCQVFMRKNVNFKLWYPFAWHLGKKKTKP